MNKCLVLYQHVFILILGIWRVVRIKLKDLFNFIMKKHKELANHNFLMMIKIRNQVHL
jgi:hypothetical protein